MTNAKKTTRTERKATKTTTKKQPSTESIITPAQIDWQSDDNGHVVPFSNEFGDVYRSVVYGLVESRYVFLEQNSLAERFEQMKAFESFTIAELGFGTGLNFFATWELWKKIRFEYQGCDKQKTSNSNNKHLHFISFEKYPLTKDDFTKLLQPLREIEPQLIPLMDDMITNYPTLVAGCHRLNFYNDNITLDLWFGDTDDSLAKLSEPIDNTGKVNVQEKNGKVNAWFLDGFSPSCNEGVWTEEIFSQMARLSSSDASVTTFSSTDVIKQGLQTVGFDVAEVKGYGDKNQIIKGIFSLVYSRLRSPTQYPINDEQSEEQLEESNKIDIDVIEQQPTNIEIVAVIGAGVSGLMSAWALANRGVSVVIFDKIAPLAGASGNPRGLLSPKMTPLHHVDEHLHSIGYLYSSRVFRQMDALSNSRNQVLEPTGAMDILKKSNIDTDKISAYPQDFAQVLSNEEAKGVTGLQEQELSENQYLPQAGLVNPQALADVVLAHPLITFKQADISQIDESAETGQVSLITAEGQQTQTGSIQTNSIQTSCIKADHAIICLAHKSCQLDKRIFDFRKIRGQLSWFTPTDKQLNKLPKIPLKYGGYCATFVHVLSDDKKSDSAVGKPQFLLGASFIRNDMDSEVREEEHVQSLHKLTSAIAELKGVLLDDMTDDECNIDSINVEKWHGRVGIRAQTPDYHPLVGQLSGKVIGSVGDSSRISTLSGMGSKGYAYAPICAEVLADQIMGRIPPLSTAMLDRLSPNRKRLQQPLK